MKNTTKPLVDKTALISAVLLAMGASSAMALPTSVTATFDMWDPTGARAGTQDTAVTGNFDIIARSATLSSTQPFFGLLWTAYNATLYGPGTYTVSTNDDGCGYSICASGTPLTFTVPAGHVAAHMKFAWGATGGIDVVNIWNTAGTSTDVEGDGVAGMDMVDGPFIGFSANFNINPSAAANTAPAVSNLSLTTLPGTPVSWTPTFTDNVDAINDTSTATCSVASQPAGGVGVATVTNCSTASFNPQGLPDPSVVTFTYQVNDRHFYNNIGTGTVTVTVSATPPPTAADAVMTVNGTTPRTLDLSSSISDADGNEDLTTLAIDTQATHGTAVSNGNGTVTYTADAGFTGTDTFTYTVADLDTQTSNAATVTVTVLATAPAVSTGTYTPGVLATSVGSTDGSGLTEADVGTDSAMAQQCVGGCFDFEVSGIVGSATVVLPLSAGVPATTPYSNRIQYRKLINGQWQDFSTNDGSVIASAAAISTSPLVCPAAGSSDYSNGLTAGHRCLQLTIVDGGDNDADGAVNGTVVDPGGIGVGVSVTSTIDDPAIGTSGGGGAFGWWTLAGLLTWLGLQRRRIMR